MSKIEVSVGGAAGAERDAAARFISAWRRAERGENVHERHVAFESWEGLVRVLTPKRVELLRHLRRHPARSIRALSKAVGRDYSNVHADVGALAGAGLLDTSDGGVRADYDAIQTRIAL